MNAYRTGPPREIEMKQINWHKYVYLPLILAGINGGVYKLAGGGGLEWRWNPVVVTYMILVQLFLGAVIYNANKLVYHKKQEDGGQEELTWFEWYTFPKTFLTRLAKFTIWSTLNYAAYSILNSISIVILLNMIVAPIVLMAVKTCMSKTEISSDYY